MREIKFRAWDTKSESMEYEIAIGKGYSEDSYILFLGLGETFIIDDDIVKIMQYTGLKDKNGVEIYEGDVIKVLGNKCTIFWQQGAFKFQNIINYNIQPLFDFATINKCVAYEVIGNIYENPDLLKG